LAIVRQPLDPTDLKQQRLIGDMSLGTLKLNVRVAEGQYRAKRDGGWRNCWRIWRGSKKKTR
jgi:hypothetical protein